MKQAASLATASARISPSGEQMQLSKVTLPLQPHQARNLCIERNLMSDTSDEYDGQLEQRLKFQRKSYIKSNIRDTEEDGEERGHQRGDATGQDEEQSAGGSNGGGFSRQHHHNPHYPENRTPLIRLPLSLPISHVQKEMSSQQHVKTKETNKLQNRNDLSEASAGASPGADTPGSSSRCPVGSIRWGEKRAARRSRHSTTAPDGSLRRERGSPRVSAPPPAGASR